ncbi:MAG: hypothetical protein NDI75_03280 [Candidatus Didemnitutus sp.]|nr:hypothetical protein [Candidatus Didemnitutus sp.]
MKPLHRLLLLAFAGLAFTAAPAAESFPLTDDFVAYMKSVTNPHDFGRRDGKFFPYSTLYGRRIGYGRPVDDAALYHAGETPAAAEQHLRRGLAATAAELATWLAREFPDRPFAALDRTQQELLVDHAHTEGVAQVNRAFAAAVLRADWDALLDGHLYVRGLGNWPDTIKNRAFGQRWIYGDKTKALRPLPRAG